MTERLTDAQVVFLLRARSAAEPDGLIGRTWRIATWLGIRTDQARDRMLKLQRVGAVRRSERYSAVNDTAWEFVA